MLETPLKAGYIWPMNIKLCEKKGTSKIPGLAPWVFKSSLPSRAGIGQSYKPNRSLWFMGQKQSIQAYAKQYKLHNESIFSNVSNCESERV